MSITDAFIYNFLAMGVIFPWSYLWGPASFPGSNIEFGIWLAFLAQIPISLAYCYLGTVLPVTGGDYIFQTRAFGRWGFISVMSGFVIWILQWIALSGWLFATLGLGPLLLSLGVFVGLPSFIKWSIVVQSPWGVFSISLILALITTVFLNRGLRIYVRVQKVLFLLTIAAIVTVLYIFFSHRLTFSYDLNRFISALATQGIHVPDQMRGNFTGFLEDEVRRSGFSVTHAFSFLATLGIVPIAWTSFQWSTYSAEQNAEIAEADRFWKQFVILVGSAFLVALCLTAVAHFEHEALSTTFMTIVSAIYWLQKGSPDTVTFLKTVVQPFPNVLAMVVSGSVFSSCIIALGFLANAFQVTCNCFIGVSRILVAMSGDGLLPRRLQLESIDPRFHAPVRANWFYLAAAVPWIIAYNFVSSWPTYSLGVTFACGYVFTLSALAATRISSDRMVSFWRNSTIYNIGPTRFLVTGYLGFVLGASMVCAYLFLPQLGLTGDVPYIIVAGIVVASYLVYILARFRSDLVDRAFKETPLEIKQFQQELGR